MMLRFTHSLVLLIFLIGGCSQAPLKQAATAGKTTERLQRQVLVTITNTKPSELQKTASEVANRYRMKQIAAWPISVLDVHCFIYTISSEDSAAAIVSRLRTDPQIDSAQLMNLFEVRSYNDPYVKLQKNLDNIPIEQIHKWSTGKGVKIAIVDSGVEVNHPDLHSELLSYKSFVDDELNQGPSTAGFGDKHGTAIAGVISAKPNNLIGIAGLAPDATVMALKACWPKNKGSDKALCNSFTLARALNVAVQAKVDIINLSLAGPKDPLLERILRVAMQQSICVVAAYAEGSHVHSFPASMSGVIGVRAAMGLVTTGADREQQAANASVVSLVAAPGTEILTTVPKDSYDFMSGSSLATATVSGLVALMLAHQPNIPPEEIKRLLIRNAHLQSKASVAGSDTVFVIDSCRTISFLSGTHVC